MWRSTGDIFDSWESVKSLIKQQYDILPFGGQGCFNDMDMLIVGMNGRGNVGLTGCSENEYKLHFAAWCLLESPLMIGCDIRSMTKETKAILTNRALIDIQQDPRCNRPYLFKFAGNDDFPIIVRALANGDIAVGFFNLSDAPRESLGRRGRFGPFPFCREGRSSGRKFIRAPKNAPSTDFVRRYRGTYLRGLSHESKEYRLSPCSVNTAEGPFLTTKWA